MGAQWKQKWRELAADQKGKIVGKLVREIQVATKLGGPHPEFNARLAAAVAVAKKQSVNRDAIERAIAKGSGTGPDAVDYTTVVYEGFAPHRVPIVIECLTDNNNRTASEMKMFFKNAGSLGTPGSVAWMFDRCGMIEATHTDSALDLETVAIEADADDFESLDLDDDADGAKLSARFYCQIPALDTATKHLKAAGWTVSTTELTYRPKECPDLSDEQRDEVSNFLQNIDGHGDVHRVHAAMK